ncbi:MAG TPA: Uma2 family endonuclease [Humisphaera sp.]|jgi:Uma2 family endonuclease|nr:Uma2 family endonuclease [Humisphaera sp.]
MGLPKTIKRHTPEEYYRLERDAPVKNDYFKGEIFAMAGGSRRHSLITMNINGELRTLLKGSRCVPYESNLRLKVEATGLRTYPDASVYCGQMVKDEEDTAGETFTNPTVIFEVLSRSTEPYDRGAKCESYLKIDSLQMFVLVSQDSPRCEFFQRQADGSWQNHELHGLDAVLEIPSIGVQLPLGEIYDRVDFAGPLADER